MVQIYANYEKIMLMFLVVVSWFTGGNKIEQGATVSVIAWQ
jgi:hypothetical protein